MTLIKQSSISSPSYVWGSENPSKKSKSFLPFFGRTLIVERRRVIEFVQAYYYDTYEFAGIDNKDLT